MRGGPTGSLTVLKGTRGVEEVPGGLSKQNTSSEKVHHSAMGMMFVPSGNKFLGGIWSVVIV